MAAVRSNIVTDERARKSFVDGVLALKEERLGPTTEDVGMDGPPRPLSTYDLFIIWHHLAMMRFTPPSQTDRNAAHSGPAFLPWHRLMLVLFELQMQRVLGDDTVGLPYWNWAVDGDLDPGQQPSAPLWDAATGIGGSGDPVSEGPFRSSEFRVEIASTSDLRLIPVNRGLRRALGASGFLLPTTDEVTAALDETALDQSPWNSDSGGFRNRLEGWLPNPPGLHNVVHVWTGGDMRPPTSPNDPVFYLNHCNVDRIWEAWMTRHGRTYAPPSSASTELAGHRLDDPLYSILTTQPVTPAELLDPTPYYSYDTLP